jgi:hypothetical protein
MNLQNVKDYLNSEEGIKSAKEYFNKISNKNKIIENQINRLKDSGRFIELLEKSIIKYNSKEYIIKSYKKGIEPPNSLHWFLYKYATIYGEECSGEEFELYGNMFTSDLVYYEGYYFNLMQGQGSCIIITKKED